MQLFSHEVAMYVVKWTINDLIITVATK